MCGRATPFAATTASSRSPASTCRDLAEEYGTPLFVDRRGRLPVARAARSPPRSAAASTCTTPPRRSCAPRSRAGSTEEGLSLDVCSGGELAVALHAGFPAERIALHGNNKSVAELDRGGQGRRRARRARLVDRDRAARRHRAASAGVVAGRAGPRHRRRRGAHPRVHLHRARGPEVRAVAGQRRGRRRCGGCSQADRLCAGRAAQPHRLADLRHRRASRWPRTA